MNFVVRTVRPQQFIRKSVLNIEVNRNIMGDSQTEHKNVIKEKSFLKMRPNWLRWEVFISPSALEIKEDLEKMSDSCSGNLESIWIFVKIKYVMSPEAGGMTKYKCFLIYEMIWENAGRLNWKIGSMIWTNFGMSIVNNKTLFKIYISITFPSDCWRWKDLAPPSWKEVMRRSGEKSVELLSPRPGPASGSGCRLARLLPWLLVCLWRHKATQDLVPGFSRRLRADQGPVLSRSRRHQHVGAQTDSRHPHPRLCLRHRLQGGEPRPRLRGPRCLGGRDWRLELLI